MKELFEQAGIFLTDTQREKFVAYCRLLKEYNEKFNLTAITDETEIVVKHFIDSVKGLPYLPAKGLITDIGSGAGFPSVPLRIMTEGDGKKFVLLDSLDKRVGFLNTLIKELDLHDIAAFHERAEDEAEKSRGKYDCVLARAVAALPTLVEYAMPLLKIGGTLVAYKSDAAEEIKAADNAMRLTGGKLTGVYSYTLNCEYRRCFVVVGKIARTPEKYPRGQNKPKISPL
jgi:16S rRNA (guanine527-N7)-methyltransferase